MDILEDLHFAVGDDGSRDEHGEDLDARLAPVSCQVGDQAFTKSRSQQDEVRRGAALGPAFLHRRDEVDQRLNLGKAAKVHDEARPFQVDATQGLVVDERREEALAALLVADGQRVPFQRLDDVLGRPAALQQGDVAFVAGDPEALHDGIRQLGVTVGGAVDDGALHCLVCPDGEPCRLQLQEGFQARLEDGLNAADDLLRADLGICLRVFVGQPDERFGEHRSRGCAIPSFCCRPDGSVTCRFHQGVCRSILEAHASEYRDAVFGHQVWQTSFLPLDEYRLTTRSQGSSYHVGDDLHRLPYQGTQIIT